jgi:hypothetical protein
MWRSTTWASGLRGPKRNRGIFRDKTRHGRKNPDIGVSRQYRVDPRSNREFSGNVEVKAGGRVDWVPAAPGMEIGMDTVISTGFKSTARISLGNSILTIRHLTRLTVAELAQRGNGHYPAWQIQR